MPETIKVTFLLKFGKREVFTNYQDKSTISCLGDSPMCRPTAYGFHTDQGMLRVTVFFSFLRATADML